MSDLVAPFPYFGGKRRIAAEVWRAIGDVDNYVEPFFGSGAVLLARPHVRGVETVNDACHFIANFWRAVAADPLGVAAHADWPINEADLHSRHWWLLTEGASRIAKCDGDPAHYDAQVAGWWLWGACAWIGSGWCDGQGPWQWDGETWTNRKLPHMSAGRGINRKLPHMGAGQGINRQLPHMGAGRGQAIAAWMQALADRLRGVRVACGDWARLCGPSVTWHHGITGVFLDPPYGVEDRARTYRVDSFNLSASVREWAIEQGRNPCMRIVLAGYDGEHALPADWRLVEWKAHGGYGSQGDREGRVNRHRERLWLSPHCAAPAPNAQPSLFGDAA
jgi:hypothetical protein